jgi:hypothetical protein
VIVGLETVVVRIVRETLPRNGLGYEPVKPHENSARPSAISS